MKNQKDTAIISVDDIEVGEELGYPVFDECGLLLLAEGTVLTDRFRDQLKSHGIYDVLVPKSYLEQDQSDPEPNVGADGSAEQVDFKLLEKIDQLITTGQLHVENNGPRFRNDVVVHQLDPYNLKGRQSFIHLHRRSVE